MPEYKNLAENTMLSDAIALATMAHRGQIRKDPSEMPYVIHPLHVMQLLMEHGVDDKRILAAAVLHDVVEDTHIGIELIQRQFGDYIADIVAALSKDAGNKGTMHEKSAAGHQQTMDRVREFPFSIKIHGVPHNVAVLVKQADRLSNLQGAFPDNWDVEKHEQYLNQSYDILNLDIRSDLAQDLDDHIKEYSIFINEMRTKVES